MPATVKRPYHSPLREQAAENTRSQIRHAAARLFAEHGYVSTTMRQVAHAAGVGTRTVFAAFPGGKAELFAEALGAALGGDDTFVPLAARSATQQALKEPDARRAVELMAEQASALYERAGPLIIAYMQSAGVDPQMRRHAEQGAAAAAQIMHDLAAALQARGALRPGLSVKRAGDILLALLSPQVHHILRGDRGWSSRDYRDWLIETITNSLLRS